MKRIMLVLAAGLAATLVVATMGAAVALASQMLAPTAHAQAQYTVSEEYQIQGNGNGQGFQFTVSITGVGTASFTVPPDPQPGSLPPGTTAQQFAARIATEIQALSGTLPGISAQVDPVDNTKFSIKYVDSQPREITLYVGDTSGCKVTGAGCSFNPTIRLLSAVGVGGIQALPDTAESAPATAESSGGASSATYAAIGGVAVALVVVGAGGWYARRRWLS
jgi:hypothetical protein